MSFGKRLRPVKYSVFFLFFLTLSASLVQADSSLLGKSYAPVVSTLGEPLSKQEYEVKRREIWVYKDQKVYLERGRVVHIGSGKAAHSTITKKTEASASATKEPASKKTSSVRTVKESEIDDLLSAVEAAGEQDENKKTARSKRRTSRRSR